jgi:hypothetical protein
MGDHVFLWLLLVGSCEAFFPPIGMRIKPSIFPATSMSVKANIQMLWAPTIPKVVDLSKGALVTDRGVKKQDFEAFFSNIESSSYLGYKWELADNEVCIFDMASGPHEKSAGTFDSFLADEARRGNWEMNIIFYRSVELINPAPNDSNWQADSSFVPVGRLGPMGSADCTTPYPAMVLEVASSETEPHVKARAAAYLANTPSTGVQIVIVLLLRPKKYGADRLKILKYERGRQNPCWECAFADPACTRAGDPAFTLPLPVRLLFDNAPIPAALVGKTNVELDLFLWKELYSLV